MSAAKTLLFYIKSLSSGYSPGKPVLLLDELKLYSNEITFIIGKSGSGKSTLLETLGFMNNTILSEDMSQVLYYDQKNQECSIGKLWKAPIEKHASFRNANFSFIFQENNLLEHFSAFENILVPMMLNNVSESDARNQVRQAFLDIHLSDDLMDKNIKYLSGGQRQRVSFLRAMMASKPVLFGDEPTGNLDPVTARALMKMIRDSVKSHKSSAIIVSHDLNLASAFADRILVLKVGEGQVGILDDVFEKTENGWIGKSGADKLVYDEISYLV